MVLIQTWTQFNVEMIKALTSLIPDATNLFRALFLLGLALIYQKVRHIRNDQKKEHCEKHDANKVQGQSEVSCMDYSNVPKVSKDGGRDSVDEH